MLKGSLKKANQARHIRLHGLTKHQRNLMDCERIEKAGLAKIKDYANQQDCSRLELAGYLQETLLRDADATTMAQGLELRVPFLDQGIVDLALQIPQHIHQMEGNKTLLRRLAAPLGARCRADYPKTGLQPCLSPLAGAQPTIPTTANQLSS